MIMQFNDRKSEQNEITNITNIALSTPFWPTHRITAACSITPKVY